MELSLFVAGVIAFKSLTRELPGFCDRRRSYQLRKRRPAA